MRNSFFGDYTTPHTPAHATRNGFPTATGYLLAFALLYFFGFSWFGLALGTAEHGSRIVARLGEVLTYPFTDHKTNFVLATQLGKTPYSYLE